MKAIFWQGSWIDEAEFGAKLERIRENMNEALQVELTLDDVIRACNALSIDLCNERGSYAKLQATLAETMSEGEASSTLKEIGEFLSEQCLRKKIVREFGTSRPHEYLRIDYDRMAFEAYAPLGVLTHITPTNAVSVPALSAIEGLLALNVNIVKISPRDSLFTHQLLESLCLADPTDKIASRLIVARFPSSRKEWMARIYQAADGVAIWGGEEAVAAVKEDAGSGVHIIAWGPKISFAYLTKDQFGADEILNKVAEDICVLDQQACSSPQIVYLDTANKVDLQNFGKALAGHLEAQTSKYPLAKRSLAESAEISNVVQVAKLEENLDLTYVISSKNLGDWNVLVDYRPAMRTSPLYRNIWIKSLPRSEIMTILRPMRQYLQTVGLACDKQDYGALVEKFVAAGCLRVTEVGAMAASYAGEPHDGTMALTRYSRRVSVQADQRFAGASNLSDYMPRSLPKVKDASKITNKEDFQNQTIGEQFKDLTFKSGGSSGAPKLSYFTYEDYHFQMQQAAQGVVAAGFEPAKDRCINLFFSGGLYGGFLSFFTILESLRAKQLPMAAVTDWAFVAQMIEQNHVNTIFGMPSYIIQLFNDQGIALKRYGKIEKIFFGGEHFNAKQKQRLKEQFGVRLIRSGSYGSVDAGPMGYQCDYCEGSIHHLFSELQVLEIFKVEEDVPVSNGEAGRLLFTSRSRKGQNLVRYEIGDLGRWVEEPCPCGRTTPRFELLGRFGNIFRIGTTFVNYQMIANILADYHDYAGELQIKLHNSGNKERMELCISEFPQADGIVETLVEHYKDLHEAVEIDRCLDISVSFAKDQDFERTPGSGKLRAVIDMRR
jgi:phenylacetate-coenzyme A ligase PaaK-like adenylate-forming protein